MEFEAEIVDFRQDETGSKIIPRSRTSEGAEARRGFEVKRPAAAEMVPPE
jgi:hypothetical protein